LIIAQNQTVQGNLHFGALNQKRLARTFPGHMNVNRP